MTTDSPTDLQVSRLSRQASYSARSFWACAIAVLLGLGCLYLLVEVTTTTITGHGLLLPTLKQLLAGNSPYAFAAAWPVRLGGGITLIIIGIILMYLALTPGRLRRHQVQNRRFALVVDNIVIASSLSRALRQQLALGPKQVRSWVGTRRADATITPTTGCIIDQPETEQFLQEQLDSYQLEPEVKASLDLRTDGRLPA